VIKFADNRSRRLRPHPQHHLAAAVRAIQLIGR